MNFKNMLLISFLLMILSMGIVAASDNSTSDAPILEDSISNCDEDLISTSDFEDEIIAQDSDEAILSDEKINPVLDVSVGDVNVGEDVTVTVHLTPEATGDVFATVDGINYTITLTEGVGSVAISGLGEGIYLLTVSYSGDGSYNPVSVNNTFKVVSHDKFSDLQSLIDAASIDDTVTLTQNYTGDSTTISISKSITLDGNGYALNALNTSSILRIIANNCIVKNLVFRDFMSTENGGAIVVTGKRCILFNCTFEGGVSLKDGGAVYWSGDDGIINCTTIISSFAMKNGGGVYLEGSGCQIAYSYFGGCSAKNGGAVYCNGDSGKVDDSMFSNNHAANNGGGVYGINTTILNSFFDDNVADELGGAIYNCYYENCAFVENSDPEVYLDGALRLEAPIMLIIGEEDVTNTTVHTTVDDVLELNIILPENITGMVTVLVNGSEQISNITVINGKCSVLLPTGAGGLFDIEVRFNGTTVYSPSRANLILDVLKHHQTVAIEFVPNQAAFEYGSVFTIGITNNTEATVTINGKSYSVVDGKVEIDTKVLSPGDYYVTAECVESEKYYAISNTTAFTISKIVPAITAEFLYDRTIHVDLPDDAEGIVWVSVGGKNFTGFVADGEVLFDCDEIPAGQYNVTVNYMGDDKYVAKSIVFPVDFSKLYVNITFQISDIHFGDSAVADIYSFKNITEEVIVQVYSGDVLVCSRSANLLNCEAHTMIEGLSAGSYTANVTFPENSTYLAYPNSIAFKVLKKECEMNITVEGRQIRVTLSADATGFVIFQLKKVETGNMSIANGTTPLNQQNVAIVNGKAILNVSEQFVGNYNVTVNYPGDESYAAVSKSVIAAFAMLLSAVNITVDVNEDDGMLTVNAPDNLDGDITVEINGKIFTNQRTIDLRQFNPGNYTYTLQYTGDATYSPSIEYGNITLTKTTLNINVTADDMVYGKTQSITAVVADNQVSSVEFAVFFEDNLIENATSPVNNGVATCEFSSPKVGTYRVNVKYLGDKDYYTSTSQDYLFKVAPSITFSPDVIIGDDGLITMELGAGTEGDIFVFVDTKRIGMSAIFDGEFSYALPTTKMTVGNHTLTFTYDGSSFDENIFSYWDNITDSYKPIEYMFTITQKQTDTNTRSDNDNLFSVTLKDSKGQVLTDATGNVSFTIVNQYTQETVTVVAEIKNGIASIDISRFKDGSYTITWHYAGDENHTAITKEFTLTIIHKASRIAAADASTLYTVAKTYSVTVYTGDGSPLAGASVKFLINGKLYRTVTTNSNGVASVSISQNPGSYKLTVQADKVSVTKKLTVKHIVSLAKVKVKRSAKKLVIKVTLAKVNGKYLKNKKITLKFNGKKYTAKTGKKGVAKFTIKKSVLKKLKNGKKVTYSATYLKDTVKTAVKIKK